MACTEICLVGRQQRDYCLFYSHLKIRQHLSIDIYKILRYGFIWFYSFVL